MLYNCTVDIRDGNFVLVEHRKIGDCLHLSISSIIWKLKDLEYLQTTVPEKKIVAGHFMGRKIEIQRTTVLR